MLDYFRAKSRRRSTAVDSPILSREDEAYFAKLAGEETPPPLPARPDPAPTARRSKSTDAQIALMDGADTIPLPASPRAEEADDRETVEQQTEAAVNEAVAEAGKAETEDKQKTDSKSEEKDQKEPKSPKPRHRRPLSFALSFPRRKSQVCFPIQSLEAEDHRSDSTFSV
jgi:hypothetical protein